jgi:hypothetical protein
MSEAEAELLYHPVHSHLKAVKVKPTGSGKSNWYPTTSATPTSGLQISGECTKRRARPPAAMRDATWQAIPRSKGNTLQTHSLSQGASGPTSSQHNLSLLQTNGMIPASCPFDEQPDLQKWVMTVLCPDMRESDFDPSDWGPLTLSDLGNCTVCLAPAVYPDIILPTTLLLPHRPATSAPQQPWATTEPPLPRDDRPPQAPPSQPV